MMPFTRLYARYSTGFDGYLQCAACLTNSTESLLLQRLNLYPAINLYGAPYLRRVQDVVSTNRPKPTPKYGHAAQ